MRNLVFSFLLLTCAATAEASECGWNADRSFWSCDGNNGAGGVGSSSPNLGDSVSSNPAALPTDPTPFGLEGIFSDRSFPKGRPKFSGSTIKGFEGVGFGLGAWSDGTFGAPDFQNHFLASENLAEYKSWEANPPSSLGLRAGVSAAFPRKKLPKGISLAAGGSLGLGRVSGQFDPQVGVLLKLYGLGVGYSKNFTQISRALPKVTVSTIAAGIFLGRVYLGYSHLTLLSDVNLTYAQVFNVRYIGQHWTFYASTKSQKDHRGIPYTWERAGVQRRLNKVFGLGYDYGLYRYAHSLVLQIYL